MKYTYFPEEFVVIFHTSLILVTRLWAGWLGFSSLQGRGRDFFFFSHLRPRRFWGPPILLSVGYQGV